MSGRCHQFSRRDALGRSPSQAGTPEIVKMDLRAPQAFARRGHRGALGVSVEDGGCRADAPQRPQVEGLEERALGHHQRHSVRGRGHADREPLGGTRSCQAIDLLAQVVVEPGEREGLHYLAVLDSGCHGRVAAPGADGAGVLGELQREDDEAVTVRGLDVAAVDDGLVWPGHLRHRRREVRATQSTISRAHRGSAGRLGGAGREAGEEQRAGREEKASPHSFMTPSRPDHHRTPTPDLRPRRIAHATAGPSRCLSC
jgi:hypothetical protein